MSRQCMKLIPNPFLQVTTDITVFQTSHVRIFHANNDTILTVG